MDRDTGPARVIVGVHDSLTGLAALREASRLARALGVPLCALRACACPQQGSGSGWGPAQAWTPPPPPSVWEAAEREGLDFIQETFSEAFGDVPRGVLIEAAVTFAPPWEALPVCADETDILVVGASRKRWRPLGRPVAPYCSAHAPCPVLVVPRHPADAELALASRPLGWLRRRRELAGVERLALFPAVPQSRLRPR